MLRSHIKGTVPVYVQTLQVRPHSRQYGELTLGTVLGGETILSAHLVMRIGQDTSEFNPLEYD